MDDQSRSWTLDRASCRLFCRDLSSSVEFCLLSMAIEAADAVAKGGGDDGVWAVVAAAVVVSAFQ